METVLRLPEYSIPRTASANCEAEIFQTVSGIFEAEIFQTVSGEYPDT